MNRYTYSELPVCTLTNGMQYALPIHEIGDGNGPVMGISALIHGDEFIGVEIVRQVLNILKNTEVKGTVKILSAANALSFDEVSRFTPGDGLNINRIFPGSYSGTLTQINAQVICEQFLKKIDMLIDIHSGGRECAVDYAFILNDEGFSRASLYGVFYQPSDNHQGTTAQIAVERNIPAVILEQGGGPNHAHYIKKGVDGLLNMLRYKGFISDQPLKKADGQILFEHIEHVTPRQGGLYVPNYGYEHMNKVIEGRVLLGGVCNPKTLEIIEELFAPYERNMMILMRGNIARTLPGDYTYMISDMETAKRL